MNGLDSVGAELPPGVGLGFKVYLDGAVIADVPNPATYEVQRDIPPGNYVMGVSQTSGTGAGRVEGAVLEKAYIEPSGIPAPPDDFQVA